MTAVALYKVVYTIDENGCNVRRSTPTACPTCGEVMWAASVARHAKRMHPEPDAS